MTREELHTLVDIVMDARERTKKTLFLNIEHDVCFLHWNGVFRKSVEINSNSYPTFSDFTQAVKEYIKILELKT